MTRKVSDASVKLYGSRWKHRSLKPYNGRSVTVVPSLDADHRTRIMVSDGRETICIITSEQRQ
jgi:hypothetical protein